jgi:hypothetical protein
MAGATKSVAVLNMRTIYGIDKTKSKEKIPKQSFYILVKRQCTRKHIELKGDDSDSSAFSDAAVGEPEPPGFQSDGLFYNKEGEVVEPFMEWNGLKASGDGSPAFGFAILKDERLEEDDKCFSNNSGPFHNYMEFMKKSKGAKS